MFRNLNIADELSDLGGVLSKPMRSKELGFAERRATCNRYTPQEPVGIYHQIALYN